MCGQLCWIQMCTCSCRWKVRYVVLGFSAPVHLVSSFILDVKPNNSRTPTRCLAPCPRSSIIPTTMKTQTTTTYPCCSCPLLLTSLTTSARCVWQRATASSKTGRAAGSPVGETSELTVRMSKSLVNELELWLRTCWTTLLRRQLNHCG